jgi:hypothetical protein
MAVQLQQLARGRDKVRLVVDEQYIRHATLQGADR